MKEITRNFLLAILCLAASGCLDLTEEITLNSNGSGTYINTMDATQLMEQMSGSAVDSTGQMAASMGKTLDSTFEENAKKFKRIKGVSAVRMDKSVKNLFKISLDFSDIDVLNKVLDIDKSDEDDKQLYSWSKGKLTRKDGGMNFPKELFGDDNGEMTDAFLSDMKYTIIYHLPKEVKSMNNKNATLSDKRKTVSLEVSLSDVKDKIKSLSNLVKY